MSQIRSHICPNIKIMYFLKCMFYIYIVTYYVHTHILVHWMKYVIAKKPQNCKIIILEQMQDYSYGSVALTHLCYSMFSWVEEKGTVTAVVRSIVHMNTILHIGIKLRAEDIDHIYKSVVCTPTLRHILRNKSPCWRRWLKYRN